MDKRLESLNTSLNYLNPKKDKIDFLKQMLKYDTNTELTNDLVKLIRQSCNTLNSTSTPNNYLFLVKCVEYLKEIVKSEYNIEYLNELYSLLDDFQIFFEKEISIDYDSATLKKTIIKVNNEIETVKGKIERRIDSLTEQEMEEKILQDSKQIIEKKQEVKKVKNLNKEIDEKYEIVKFLLFGQRDIHKLIETLKNFDYLAYCIKENSCEIFDLLADKYLDSLLKDSNDRKYYYMVIVLLSKDFYGFNDSKARFINELITGYKKIQQSALKKDKKELLSHDLDEIIKICDNKFKKIHSKHNITIVHKYNDLDNIDNYKIEGTKNLYDFTKEKIFTIDSEHAKCLDDAISIKLLENGNYLIGVYIADTTCVVHPNTAIDDYAFNIGETFGKKFLLPPVLSNDLCSLNDSGCKRVQAFLYEVTTNNIIVNSKVCSALIKVKRNFTYEQTDALLMDILENDYSNEIKQLYSFIKYRLEHSIARQKYFEIKDIKKNNMLDNNNLSSSLIISELKLLVNSTVAEKIYKIGAPFIYLNSEKIDIILPEELQIIFESNKSLANLKGYILDEYGESYYSSINKGIYGLGLDSYAHLTTPLRNYSAMYDQRIVKKVLIDDNLTDKESSVLEKELPIVTERQNKIHTLNKVYKFSRKQSKLLK